MLFLSAKRPRPLGRRKTPCERRFGEKIKGPKILCGAMVEYHPISTRDLTRLHQFGKKVLLGIFLGYELIAGRNLERTDSDCGVGRFGIVGCLRNLSSKNQRQRKEMNSYSQYQMVQQKFQWRTSSRIGRVSTDRIYR